jgi:hypothetical protein
MRIKSLLVTLVLLVVIPSFAQMGGGGRGGASAAPSVQIVGVVQSFTSNILDVKPADSPAVWITIPLDLQVDRSQLKPGVTVAVQATWMETVYVASQVTIQN